MKLETAFTRLHPWMLLPLALLAFSARAQSISTIAGGGTADGRPATLVAIQYPQGVAVDSSGNIYVSDYGHSRVRRIDSVTGIITTVAGNGIEGSSSDGVLATTASIRSPGGLAFDKGGNLLLSTEFGGRIRKIDLGSGIISTIAGSHPRGFGGDGGPATAAKLGGDGGMTVDGEGNLYIADSENNRIRRIDSRSGLISTVAGSGTCGFFGDGGPATLAGLCDPQDVAFDNLGSIYIADRYNARIRRVRSDGLIETVVGNGEACCSGGDGVPATSTAISSPTSVAISASGTLLFGDSSTVREVRSDGNMYSVAGAVFASGLGDNGPATAARIFQEAFRLDALGNLYIADGSQNRLRRVDRSSAMISTVAGTGQIDDYFGDGGPATAAVLSGLDFVFSAIAADQDGNLYIIDGLHNRVRRVDAATRVITTVAGNGNAGFGGDGGLATASQLSPSGVAIDREGRLYVVDKTHSRIRRVDLRTGQITHFAGNGTTQFSGDGGPPMSAGFGIPSGIGVDREGNVYVADTGHQRVRKIDVRKNLVTTLAGTGEAGFSGDGGAATEARLSSPRGVAVDATGTIYIADSFNHRVRRILNSGLIETVAGGGSSRNDGVPATTAYIYEPVSVGVDMLGNLYLADRSEKKVQKVSLAERTITILAGSDGIFPGGYEGRATAAVLDYPSALAVTNDGDVFMTNRDRVLGVRACRSPEEATLSSPADGSQGVPLSPAFRWTPSKGAISYDVYLDTQSPPRHLAAEAITLTGFSPANLAPSTAYYWQVVARPDPYCPSTAPGSRVHSFVTSGSCQAPAAPVGQGP